MTNENRKELMEYRMDSAEEKLTSAKALLDIGEIWFTVQNLRDLGIYPS